MNFTGAPTASTFARFVASATAIYLAYIEPFLSLGYAWLMWRIARSPNKILHSSFYSFFVFTGIAAVFNVLSIVAKPIADNIMPEFALKDVSFNFLIYASHSLAMTHTIGKILLVASRFTAICFPLENFWSTRRVRIAAILMFLLPALLHSFILPLKANYRLDNEGNRVYAGAETWAMQLLKLFSTVSLIIFLLLSVSMCAASVYQLRKAQRFNPDLARQEKSLLQQTIIITTLHMFKSVHQIFWFATMITDNLALFNLATQMYVYPNMLTTFVPPIILLATSRNVRQEVIPCLRIRDQENTTMRRMNFSAPPNSSALSLFIDSATSIDLLYVEPFLCVAYVWLLWRLARTHNKILQSSFYRFFIYTGIAACINVLANFVKPIADKVIPEFGLRDVVFNFIIYSSHSAAMTHTIGKVLVVASRFTAICFPLEDFWIRRRIRIAAFLMLTFPAFLHCFILPLKANYRFDNQGARVYAGAPTWAMQLLKLFSTTFLVIFLVLSVTMCAASVYQLRQAQRFNPDLAKQERSLLIQAVLITTLHMTKSVHQIFWYITMVTNNQELFNVATDIYVIPNTLTTFVPPILLLATSSIVRREIIPCLVYGLRYSPTIVQSATTTREIS